MRLEKIGDFVSVDEIADLNSFALESIKQGDFSNGLLSKNVNPINSQLVSRFNRNIKYPKTAFNIQNKLMNILKLEKHDIHTLFNESSIIVNCSFNGAQLIKHKDRSQFTDKSLLRCNLLTNKPIAGGNLFIEDSYVPLEVGDMYFCLASEHEHWVTKIEGNQPRIIWQFGFNVNKEDWNTGKIKVQNER